MERTNHFGFSSSTLVFFYQRFYWRGSGGDKLAAVRTSRRAECIHSNLGAEISCGSSSGYVLLLRSPIRAYRGRPLANFLVYLFICELLICTCVRWSLGGIGWFLVLVDVRCIDKLFVWTVHEPGCFQLSQRSVLCFWFFVEEVRSVWDLDV